MRLFAKIGNFLDEMDSSRPDDADEAASNSQNASPVASSTVAASDVVLVGREASPSQGGTEAKFTAETQVKAQAKVQVGAEVEAEHTKAGNGGVEADPPRLFDRLGEVDGDAAATELISPEVANGETAAEIASASDAGAAALSSSPASNGLRGLFSSAAAVAAAHGSAVAAAAGSAADGMASRSGGLSGATCTMSSLLADAVGDGESQSSPAATSVMATSAVAANSSGNCVTSDAAVATPSTPTPELDLRPSSGTCSRGGGVVQAPAGPAATLAPGVPSRPDAATGPGEERGVGDPTLVRPSSSDPIMEGWAIEDAATSGPSSLRSPSPLPDESHLPPGSIGAISSSGPATSVSLASVTERGAAPAVLLASAPTPAASDRSARSEVQEPGIEVASSTVSTSGAATATSDEYMRVEEVAGRSEVFRSPVAPLGEDVGAEVRGTSRSNEDPQSPSRSTAERFVAVSPHSERSVGDGGNIPEANAATAATPTEPLEFYAPKDGTERTDTPKGLEGLRGDFKSPKTILARDSCVPEIPALQSKVQQLLSEADARRAEHAEQLKAATMRFKLLQSRIVELEEEASGKDLEKQRLERKVTSLEGETSTKDAEVQRLQRRVAELDQALKQQVEDLQREVAAARAEAEKAKRLAREAADKEKEATLVEVREEMEKELESMLKQKDDQIKELRAAVSAGERRNREQARELEKHKADAEATRLDVEGLRQEGVGQLSDHRKEIESLVAEHQQRLQELEQRRDMEERMKHELAASLREVEVRGRGEIAQLEAQKAQQELQLATLQAQAQEERQKCDELSFSLGEAQQRIAQFEAEGPRSSFEEADARILSAGAEVEALRLRLQDGEEKLLEAQSMRDMFSRETDMYRTELKVARDERSRVEDELTKAQERTREMQLSQAQNDPTVAQQTTLQAMQRDFDERMERHRDEVQYLRQKCDEKDKRCEQLLMEKSSLAAELRAGAPSVPLDPADLEVGSAKGLVRAGVARPGALSRSGGSSGAGGVRSLALASPAWLRSTDEPLRMVVRTLASYPHARLVFFAYVLLLHVWVLFILQSGVIH